MDIKNTITKISNLIQWQFRPKKYYNENNELYLDVLNSLEKNSYYVYKNFFPISKINEIREKLQEYAKNHESTEEHSIYYKSRTSIPLEKKCIKSYSESNIVKKVTKHFFGTPAHLVKCTYEFKKGLKKNQYLDEKDGSVGEGKKKYDNSSHEFKYHADRAYGVLKFCLFLKDVNKDDGPFIIIPGSHKWSMNLKNFFYRIFHFANEGLKDKISDVKIDKYVNTKLEQVLTGKAGDLLIANVSAWHRGTKLKEGSTREVLWLYTKFPSLASSIKKKIIN